jgi:hypothetical protein
MRAHTPLPAPQEDPTADIEEKAVVNVDSGPKVKAIRVLLVDDHAMVR